MIRPRHYACEACTQVEDDGDLPAGWWMLGIGSCRVVLCARCGDDMARVVDAALQRLQGKVIA